MNLWGLSLRYTATLHRSALRNRLDNGDEIEFLSPGLEGKKYEVESMHDSEGFAVASARNEEVISMHVPDGVRVNDLIRRDKNFSGGKRHALSVAGETHC